MCCLIPEVLLRREIDWKWQKDQGGDRKKRWIRGERSNANWMTEEYFIKVSFITQGPYVMYPLVSGLCLLFLFISSLLSLMLFSSQPFPSICHFSHLSPPPASVSWSPLNLSGFIPSLRLWCKRPRRPRKKRHSQQQDIVFFLPLWRRNKQLKNTPSGPSWHHPVTW